MTSLPSPSVTPLEILSLAWTHRTDRELALRIAEASANSSTVKNKENTDVTENHARR